jgi:hypothetical protein
VQHCVLEYKEVDRLCKAPGLDLPERTSSCAVKCAFTMLAPVEQSWIMLNGSPRLYRTRPTMTICPKRQNGIVEDNVIANDRLDIVATNSLLNDGVHNHMKTPTQSSRYTP